MEESCLHGDFRRFYTVVCDNGFPVGGSKWRKSVASDNCVAVHVRRGDYLNKIKNKDMEI